MLGYIGKHDQFYVIQKYCTVHNTLKVLEATQLEIEPETSVLVADVISLQSRVWF